MIDFNEIERALNYPRAANGMPTRIPVVYYGGVDDITTDEAVWMCRAYLNGDSAAQIADSRVRSIEMVETILRDGMERAVNNVTRVHTLINSPIYGDFLQAVRTEAVHQVERWGEPHDKAKEPEDWLWLMGYLVGKAVRAQRDGDTAKALHHTISSAAVLLNWHAALHGEGNGFTPGDSDVQKMVEATFGKIE